MVCCTTNLENVADGLLHDNSDDFGNGVIDDSEPSANAIDSNAFCDLFCSKSVPRLLVIGLICMDESDRVSVKFRLIYAKQHFI